MLKKSALPLLAALLAACGSQQAPSSSRSGLTRINGQIQDWNATNKANWSLSLDVAFEQQETVRLTSGTIGADGEFELPLPSQAQMQPYLQDYNNFPASPNCTAALHSSNRDARIFSTLNVQVYDAKGSLAGVTRLFGKSAQGKAQAVLWTFASAPTNVTGTVACTDNGTARSTTYDLALLQGWSMTILEQSQETPNNFAARTGTPNNPVWTYN